SWVTLNSRSLANGMTGQLLGMTRGRLYSVADVRCICTCRRRRPKQSPLGVAQGGPHAIAPRRVADGEPRLGRQRARRNEAVAGEIGRTSRRLFQDPQSACVNATGNRSEARQT